MVRYRALTQAAVWRRWGDELAVYEGRSARTHLLADGHAELFGLLAARVDSRTGIEAGIETTTAADTGALSLHDIAREFESGDDADPSRPAALSADETDALRTLVLELVALGLVEAVPA